MTPELKRSLLQQRQGVCRDLPLPSGFRCKPLQTEDINSENELVAEFGPKCPDFDAGCVCCLAHLEWALRNTKDWMKEGI